MELGLCPACTRPYTVSEVTGYGILRARSAAAGGPIMELSCPGCGRLMRLIPYGEGRYAPPGEPPPVHVPPEARRPPWAAGDEGPGASDAEPVAAAAEDDPAEAQATRAAPPPEEAPREEPRAEEPLAEEPPVGLREALSLLGCTPAAAPDEIERAFRSRSRTCHPDKVAHLDPEFQALAEKKFKRLQAAYDLLRS